MDVGILACKFCGEDHLNLHIEKDEIGRFTYCPITNERIEISGR